MKKGVNKICLVCRKEFYLPLCRRDRLFCSKECYSSFHKAKVIVCKNCGKTYRYCIDSHGHQYCSRRCADTSLEMRKIRSTSKLGCTPWNKDLTSKTDSRIQGGENASNWRGGITKETELLRKKREYIMWRIAVFTRDGYTCQFCGIKNEKGLGRAIRLEADHVKPWSKYPELRLEIDNGRTLCLDCHRGTETYGRRVV